MTIELTKDQESEILGFITETLNLYESQTEDWRNQNLQIYESLSTFTEPNSWENLPRFKTNLMHIFLRQVVPRIIAKSPRPIVSPRTDVFYEWEETLEWEDRNAVIERNNKFAKAMQDYLTVVFNQENMRERLKYWVINQLTYGTWFAEVVSKTKIARSKWKGKIDEKLISVTPTLDIVSFSEMFFDPRFKIMEDMPWYFRKKQGIRLRDLHFTKNSEWKQKYFNLDKLEELGNTNFAWTSDYKQKILEITGISDISVKTWINKHSLDLEIFYWSYSIDWDFKNERLYEITTVNRTLVIWIEEITELPILDIKWHEDPEIYFSVWLLAPIIWIQDEINYQKNARATAVSKSLNRDYFWSADSWVDPSQLVGGKWWNIIYAANWVEQATRWLVEIADRPLDNSYFSDINDLNRDASRLTHTTDVTQPQGQTALTNTATGARISLFDSSSVIAELRKNFEKWVQELWHKILNWTFNNIDNDITLKRIDDWKYFRLKKEAFRDALERYDIKIEANSSSFDDIDSRRDDAIALKNIALEATQAWLNVDLDKLFKTILWTFENINPDEIIKPKEQSLEVMMWQALWWEQTPPNKPTEAAQMTEAIAWWWLTEWL